MPKKRELPEIENDLSGVLMDAQEDILELVEDYPGPYEEKTQNVLLMAAEGGHLSILNAIHGCFRWKLDYPPYIEGESCPLIAAAMNGRVDCCGMLMKKFPEIPRLHRDEKTILHVLAEITVTPDGETGKIPANVASCIRLILDEYIGYLYGWDKDKRLPLKLAIENNECVAGIFLKCYEENNAAETRSIGATILKASPCLFSALEAGYIDLLPRLVDMGMDPLVKDGEGNTLLYRAVKSGKPEAVQVVIELVRDKFEGEADHIAYLDNLPDGRTVKNRGGIMQILNAEKDQIRNSQ